MAADPTWEGLAQGLLVLGVMWWSWVGYAWLTSVVNPEEGAVRLVMFAAMAAFLVVALCVPGRVRRRGAAVRVRLRRRPLRADRPVPDRQPRRARAAPLRLGPARQHGRRRRPARRRRRSPTATLQGALWALALALDMGGPLLFDSEGWRLVPGHFAERHGLIVIIALGESIVAIGVGAEAGVDAGRRRRRGARASRSPRRCGGPTSTSSRWSPSGACRTPPRAAAQRDGARLVLLPAPPDGGRDRAVALGLKKTIARRSTSR